MRRFAVKYFIFIIPFIIILIINISIDNAYIFKGHSTYQKLGKVIAEGNNVSNLHNFDEFLTRKYALDYLTYDPQIMSFGSSRGMFVNESIFPTKTFFNVSVSHASLREIISCYSLIELNNFETETVIFCLDPAMVSNKLHIIGEQFVPFFNKFIQDRGIDTPQQKGNGLSKYRELFNPIYCFENIKYGKRDYVLTNELYLDEPVVASDGSLVYSSKYRNFTKEQVFENVLKYHKRFKGEHRYAEIQDDLTSLFQVFINLVSEDRKVVFVLTPYHPYYTNLSKSVEYQIIGNAEKFYRKVATENDIEVIGSFFPDLVETKIDSFDFYDGVHAKRETIEKMLEQHFYNNPL